MKYWQSSIYRTNKLNPQFNLNGTSDGTLNCALCLLKKDNILLDTNKRLTEIYQYFQKIVSYLHKMAKTPEHI